MRSELLNKQIPSVIIVALSVGILAGCQGTTDSQSEATPTLNEPAVVQAKVPYIGDNSEVVALLHDLGVGSFGAYTIELKTKNEPYGLILNFSELKVEASNESVIMRREAVSSLVLAKIDNCSSVTWVYPAGSGDGEWTWTADQATAAIGQDIKSLDPAGSEFKKLLQQAGA